MVKECALSVLETERPLPVEKVWALDISKPFIVILGPTVRFTVPPPPVLWGVRVSLVSVRLAVVFAKISSDKVPGM